MEKSRQGIVPQIAARRGAFAAMFAGIFLVTFGFLSLVGATPDSTGADSTSLAHAATSDVAAQAQIANPEEPVRIVAKEIGLDVGVNNPTSIDVGVLDRAALLGAVRYPTSTMLGQDGTIVLFGHSSYLPVVHNQAYKTFDDIQNLKKGSVISVYSATVEYRYSVVGVEVADATRDVVELEPNGRHLTLITCNSFATKSNRFVVTADFVGAYPLTSH